MPTVSQALTGRLLTYTALADLIGDRVLPGGFIPQDVPMPCVTFLRIDEAEDEAMVENADIVETQFEVSFLGATYDTCEAAYEQGRDAMRRFRGTVNGLEVTDMLLQGGQGPVYTDEPPCYEATQRVAIRYRRA